MWSSRIESSTDTSSSYERESSSEAGSSSYANKDKLRKARRRHCPPKSSTSEDTDGEEAEPRKPLLEKIADKIWRKVKLFSKMMLGLVVLAVVVVIVIHVLGLLVNFGYINEFEKGTKDIPKGTWRFVYLSGARALILYICSGGILLGRLMQATTWSTWFWVMIAVLFTVSGALRKVQDTYNFMKSHVKSEEAKPGAPPYSWLPLLTAASKKSPAHTPRRNEPPLQTSPHPPE